MKLTAEVHREDDGSYWAKVVDPETLGGVFASGDTLDERSGIRFAKASRSRWTTSWRARASSC
jgi:hypothetical protein